jgi:hypothetical protein
MEKGGREMQKLSFLEDFDKTPELIVDAILEHLKTQTETYGQLKQAFYRFKLELLYEQENGHKHTALLDQVFDKIIDEINSLPIKKG